MKRHTAIPDDERIITTRELLERIPLTRQSIWRMVREGRFPPPIRLTRSKIGWRLSVVLAWIAERERNPGSPRSYFGRLDVTGRNGGKVTLETKS